MISGDEGMKGDRACPGLGLVWLAGREEVCMSSNDDPRQGPVTAAVPERDIPKAEGIIEDTSGKYRWVYDLPMLKSLWLLLEVWKALAIAAAAVAVMGVLIGLVSGAGVAGILGAVEMAALVLGILLVLSVPAYLIVTKANDGRYTVLFEMDDSGIDHIQIKTEKAKALEALVVFTGVAAGNRTTTAAGLLSASGGSRYSRFSRVRRIVGKPSKNLIVLQGPLLRNQVYVTDGDFEFVWDYIVKHCPDAKTHRS